MKVLSLDHAATEALALAILQAVGIDRPVTALTVSFRAGELAQMVVEEYVPPPGNVGPLVQQLKRFVLQPLDVT